MNKGDLVLLSEIINNYSSNIKNKRDDSAKKLNDLRKKNMGLLCLSLLELSTQINFDEKNKSTCLVLLRNIIEIDSKHYWGNINQKIKEKIKQKSLDILLNNNNDYFLKENNKIIFVIEQLVHTIEDFNEIWPELIDLTNILLKLFFPQDINKIYSIIKTIKFCISFLSNEIFLHLNTFNIFFKTIFDYNNPNISIKILQTKVISCEFYSELLSYSLNNNLDDISSSINFISTNILKTFKECFNYLNNLKTIDEENQIKDLIFNLLSHIEILICPNIFEIDSEFYKELIILLYSIINLSFDKYQNIIEKSFQRLLDIILKNVYVLESKENLIKEYLDKLFKYAYNNIEINNQNNFCLVLDEYNDYELVPKIDNELLLFLFDITSQIIQEDEKYINIIQELENILNNHTDIKFKCISLLLLPQIIESINNFNEVEKYISICFNNINNQQFEIRYASFYSINYYISNFWSEFNMKYSLNFCKLIIKQIKQEQNIRIKCEIISVFNCFISHFDDEKEDKNETKQFLFNNTQEIFSFLLIELYNSKNNDTNKCLIKNELFKSLIICCQLLCNEYKPFFNDIISFLFEYLDFIYHNKIHTNLYINLLNAIICFGKYNQINFIIPKLDLIFNCIQYILNDISLFINQISNLNLIFEDIIPIINKNKPEYISDIIKNIINALNKLLNEIQENDYNHSDEIYNFLTIINTSFEIIEGKCTNYLNQIESSIEKIITKIKNDSKVNNAISNILCSIIQIISKNSSNKFIKNKGKNYMEIIFKQIENEYNSNTTISIIDNMNKIFEILVPNLTQNELEQIFNGIIKLIEFFENKLDLFISKKKKTENEIKAEEEMSMSIELDNEEEEEENDNKEMVEKLSEDIENLEQVNEGLSLIIENMMKYSSGKKLKNISDVIYNKVIPLLLNSNNNSGYNIKIAINLIDDILEYLDFNKFSPYIIEDLINKLIQYSNYNKPEVRQAANYGLGIFIKLSDIKIYNIHSEKILKALKLSCQNYPNNNSKDEKKYRSKGLANDNAIASIGKAIEYKSMKNIEYIVLWIENLPILFDETEMEEGHNILCDFIINNKYRNINIDKKYLEIIIKILIDVYGDEIKSNSNINEKIEAIFKINDFKDILKNLYIEYNRNICDKNKADKIKHFIE